LLGHFVLMQTKGYPKFPVRNAKFGENMTDQIFVLVQNSYYGCSRHLWSVHE